MDDFSDLIGYLVFFIFFVLPRILKYLAKRKQGAAPPAPKPQKNNGIPTLEEMLNGEIQTPQQAPVYSDAEREAYQTSLDQMTKALATHEEETRNLIRFAKTRGRSALKMVDIVDSTLTPAMGRMSGQLERLKKRPEPDDNAVYQLEQQLARQEETRNLLRQLTEQRVMPARADILATLDTACAEALRPFTLHASRMNLPYRTRYMLSIMDDPGEDFAQLLQHTHVGVAVVSKKDADLPKGWINMISDVGMDVCYSTQGLKKQLDAELGTLAPPQSVGHYQNHRTLAAGLVSAWLPRLFGDMVCTLYLGPGVLSGIQGLYNADDTLMAGIGDVQPTKIPLHIRVYIVARVLAHMGFQELSNQSWEAWQRRMGNPEQLKLNDGSREALVPIAPLTQAVGQVVDYFINEPIKKLGNYPLPHIPSLTCTKADIARMKKMVPHLQQGEAKNAPTRVIMGAALLAQEKSATIERRIGHAAIAAMAGKGTIAAATPIPGAKKPLSLLEGAHSPQIAAQAVALAAAIAPRRGIRGFR